MTHLFVLQVLDAAYDLGCRFWDTADLYADNEELIGKWLKRTGKRKEIFLATKFGVGPHWGSDFKRGVNGEPDYVPKALQRSLEQLGVDHVDLWYLHRYAVCYVAFWSVRRILTVRE